jgi:DNA polymerase-1
MQNKLLLIDGHNLLFQMFYGMPNKIMGKNGQRIEGIWGFTGALLKIMNQVDPTHILVIFDGEQELNRKKESESYKKNRVDYTKIEEDKNPFSILPDIKAVLEELQIKYFETNDGFETDDYIKEYCKIYENNTKIIISSWDTDYVNLVNEQVTLLTYKGKSSCFYTPEKVLTKWKINPTYFADYKALVGDASDNIAGIPRIGPKMAVSLINEFGHVENILANIENIKKESVRMTLDIFKSELEKNIKLIRLEGTGIIPIKLEDLKRNNQERKTKEVLKTLNYIEN